MNKIFPHIHTKKVLFVLNYCSKRYNHAVERNLPLTENLLPRIWLFSTAYLGVSQSLGSIAQRKRTTDRWCKLLQGPPFVSISSLTPIWGPPVAALDFRAPWTSPWDTPHSCKLTSDTLCFLHGHHHTALRRPRQDSLKPLGPHTLSAASGCLCSALEPSRFLTVGRLVGRTMQMDALFHLFLCSQKRSTSFPSLCTLTLFSGGAFHNLTNTPRLPRSSCVLSTVGAALHRPHGTRRGGERLRQRSGLHIWIQGSSPSFKDPQELMPQGALQEVGRAVC